MKVTQELIDAFLMNDDKFSYVLNRVTGESSLKSQNLCQMNWKVIGMMRRWMKT